MLDRTGSFQGLPRTNIAAILIPLPTVPIICDPTNHLVVGRDMGGMKARNLWIIFTRGAQTTSSSQTRRD